ncbi:MAG TPA: hypothetical protein PLH39_00825 [Promineifilum sp.]|nr:hypothetical protein [Promineifilum sp.]
MDSVFGIGLPELILVVVLAGMVMGPERIVRYARMLGVVTARLQSVSRAFVHQLTAELDAADSSGELRETIDELQLLRRQVAELRAEVLTIASGTAAEGKQVMRELKQAQNAIMPPNLLAATREARATTVPRPISAATPGPAVHRPPSLFPEATPSAPPATGTPPALSPALPRRVDITDDPD